MEHAYVLGMAAGSSTGIEFKKKKKKNEFTPTVLPGN